MRDLDLGILPAFTDQLMCRFGLHRDLGSDNNGFFLGVDCGIDLPYGYSPIAPYEWSERDDQQSAGTGLHCAFPQHWFKIVLGCVVVAISPVSR